MSKGNLPRRESDAYGRLTGFAKLISEAPGRYAIDPALAAQLRSSADAYEQAYLRGNAACATRNRSDVLTKDLAFAEAERVYRHVYSTIKWNNDIPDPDKLHVGVRPVNRTRTKSPLPHDPPTIGVRLGLFGQLVVGYWWVDTLDGAADHGSGKPPGVAQVQLFVATGDQPTRDHTLARICGTYTRNPCVVTFDPVDGGKIASFFARWVSTRGETGGFSAPVSMRVAA